MIKSQHLIPFLLRNISRSSSHSFQQFAKFPFNSTRELTFQNLANFSSKNDPNNAEQPPGTIPLTEAEKDQRELEDWGSRSIVSKEDKAEEWRKRKLEIVEEKKEAIQRRIERKARRERVAQEKAEEREIAKENKALRKTQKMEALEEKKEKKEERMREKKEGSKGNRFFMGRSRGYLMNRVVKTSLEYARLTPEERVGITEESRFYYVKERLKKLSEEDQKKFIECLERYDDFAYEKVKKYEIKVKVKGPPKEVQVEIYKESLPKSCVTEFIKSEVEFEPVISDLLMGLLNKENPDFISLSKDEIQVERHGKIIKDLNENLEEIRRNETRVAKRLRHSYYHVPSRGPGKPRDRVKKRIPTTFNLLRVIFIRVVQTLTVYIESPSKIKENVPKISRFYYVHKRIGNWSQAEQERLWEYLDSIRVDSAHEMTEEQVGETMNKRRILGSCNQTELFYMLNHPEYGTLFKELLSEFFEDDNLDKFYFLNAQQNESKIGEFSPAHKKMIPPVREYFIEVMENIKAKFQQYLDFSDPKQLTLHGQHPGGPKKPRIRRSKAEMAAIRAQKALEQ